jgi:hypothetical protein
MESEGSNREAYHLAGDRLGKFVILSELGRGSMGVVYEALQEDLKRKVALKVLPANISLDPKQVRRFHREAESVARLRHDNIIQIFEVGQLGNTHYFAMELVDGQPYGKPPSRDREGVRESARMARDAARGLDHAHERGVIHRDIKPGNLLVDRSGRVVVTDFGLARLSESASLTSTDAIVGTPKYMSPEQILPGKYPLDGRSDVYSLGAALYAVVAGRPPIEEPSVQAFLRSILEDRPPSPRRFNRDVPHDLATIILRCLEKDPADRYADAGALADDLDRFLTGERIHARPKGALALGYEFVRRHRIITGLAVVALIALLGWQWTAGRASDSRREAAIQGSLFDLTQTAVTNVDLAIEQLEELARRNPGHADIAETRAFLYGTRANRELESAERELYGPGILRDLEEAGLRGSHWHLVMLVEVGRLDEAGRVAATLPEGDPDRELTLARLDLRNGEFRSAIERLEPLAAAANPDPLALFVASEAYRALAVNLAGAAPEAPRALQRSAELLQRAYDESRSVRQQWLRDRIFLRKLASFQGNAVGVTELLPGLGGAAVETLNRLTTLWADMSETETEIVRQFVERVLKLAKVPPGSGTDRLRIIARERLDGAQAPREKVVANLLLAVYHLSAGLPLETDKNLDAAEDLFDPQLMPYVYWGKSLVQRSRGNLHDAIQYALFAIENVSAVEDFRDLRHLALHTTVLAEEASNRDSNEDAQRAARLVESKLSDEGSVPSDEPWVNDLLERVRSLVGRG